MAQNTERHEMTRRKVVYELPGMEAVTVRRDREFRTSESGVLTLDVYEPPDAKRRSRRPAVIFVIGYPDAGAPGSRSRIFRRIRRCSSRGPAVTRRRG